MNNIVPAVKGTRDFYPDEMAVRTWLYRAIRKVSEQYGYQEYEGPFLERIDLYAAKSGDELVNQQSFVFSDRGGDPITLRPELTPTLARMVAQKQNQLVFPLRWWSFGPFWRYERPQKGRSREFFQWNIDIIGINSPEADAELLAVCARFFEEVGLGSENVKILLNSRRLMDKQLADVGIGGELKRTAFQLIDRKDKLPSEDWREYALAQGLASSQLDGIERILGDRENWKNSDELCRAIQLMERIGLGDYVEYDPRIIRGLDYYTGIVFEAKDMDGGRSLLGGGHYDNLVAAVGGDPLPGVGFAMGDVMMGVILEKYGLLPDQSRTSAEVLVTVFDDDRLLSSFVLAEKFRKLGIKVVCYPESTKLQKQFKYADRIGIRFAAVMGPDEEADGKVTIKDLRMRTQDTLTVAEAAEKIKTQLAS